MHELGLVCSIIDAVEKAAEGRKVLCVTLEIGQLSGASPEAIAFCFPEVARGTLAEAARLEIRKIGALAQCEACGAEFPTPNFFAICGCGSVRYRQIGGEELKVSSIEIEEVV